MNIQRLSIVVLAVVVCFACMGCRASEDAAAEDYSELLMQPKDYEDSLRMQLLSVELVQEELRLTDDQLGKLDGLFKTAMTKSREIFPEVPDVNSSPQSLSQEEYKELMRKIKDLQSTKKKFLAKCFAVLTPGQMERLKQIQLQAAMPGSLERPEIIKALHLSEEQIEKIRTLHDQMKQRWSAKQSDRSNPNENERMVEFVKALYKDQVETTDRTLDILTPEQRTELEKLTGKKIDLQRIHDVWTKKGESYLADPDVFRCSSPFARKGANNNPGSKN